MRHVTFLVSFWAFPWGPRARTLINKVPEEIGLGTRHPVGIHDFKRTGRGSAGQRLKVQHRRVADPLPLKHACFWPVVI